MNKFTYYLLPLCGLVWSCGSQSGQDDLVTSQKLPMVREGMPNGVIKAEDDVRFRNLQKVWDEQKSADYLLDYSYYEKTGFNYKGKSYSFAKFFKKHRLGGKFVYVRLGKSSYEEETQSEVANRLAKVLLEQGAKRVKIVQVSCGGGPTMVLDKTEGS